MKSETRRSRESKVSHIAGFVGLTAIVILSIFISSFVRLRYDLTEDKRYTLSEPTKDILDNLENRILIQVFLDGEMPIGFKKLRRSVDDILNEFRIFSNRKIDYEFINPAGGKVPEERAAFQEELAVRGINPINVQAGDEEGGTSQKLIFPGLIINYNGAEVAVNFLRNNPGIHAEQNLAHSIEGLEYELIKTINTLTSDTIQRVAFIEGHGEISEIETGDIMLELARYFSVDRGIIGGITGVLDSYSAVIIAGPTEKFDESDKLVLDQYLMRGGKIVWLMDAIEVRSDSLATGSTIGFYRELGVEDMLFNYGVRINPVLVQDFDCLIIPIRAMSANESQSQYIPVPWLYYPLLHPSQESAITRNINKVKSNFTGYVDTVGLDGTLKKSILLTTAGPSRTLPPPVMIRLDEFRKQPPEAAFNQSSLPVALLVEGNFKSLFRNRIVSHLLQPGYELIKEGNKGAVIVVADGDVIRNEVRRMGSEMVPVPLGLDRYSMQTYGNKDFLVNAINYLADDKGLVELRGREMKIRLTDRKRVKSLKLTLQIFNTAGPVLIVLLAGLLFSQIRRYRYGS